MLKITIKLGEKKARSIKLKLIIRLDTKNIFAHYTTLPSH